MPNVRKKTPIDSMPHIPITTDTFVMSDLDDMARIDGQWDAETLLKVIKQSSCRAYVVRRGASLLGFVVVRPVDEWLIIQRLRSRVNDADTIHALLLNDAKRAVLVVNRGWWERERELWDRDADSLTGIMIVCEERDAGGLRTLRDNGFRPHHGERLKPDDGIEWVVMVWNIKDTNDDS